MEILAHSQYDQCSVALLLYRRSRICVGSLVTYVCVCGGITSLGFSVDWTSSSLSRVDLSGLSWHRSCPGHLWEAAVVWAPAYSAVYLCVWPLSAVCYNIASSSSHCGSTLVFPGTRSHVSPHRLTSTTHLSVTVPGYTTISIIDMHAISAKNRRSLPPTVEVYASTCHKTKKKRW